MIFYQILLTNSSRKCIDLSVWRICMWIFGLKGLKLPPQNPIFVHSHTHSVFLHSLKWPALVTNILFTSRKCPLTKASTGKMLYINKNLRFRKKCRFYTLRIYTICSLYLFYGRTRLTDLPHRVSLRIEVN